MSVLKPSNIYVAELHNDSDHICYHVITYEGYRQVLSVGAFFYGVKKFEQDSKRGVIWAAHREFDHHRYIEKNSLGFSTWDEDVPVVKHRSIWDFYTYIGYDYKRKKWISLS